MGPMGIRVLCTLLVDSIRHRGMPNVTVVSDCLKRFLYYVFSYVIQKPFQPVRDNSDTQNMALCGVKCYAIILIGSHHRSHADVKWRQIATSNQHIRIVLNSCIWAMYRNAVAVTLQYYEGLVVVEL